MSFADQLNYRVYITYDADVMRAAISDKPPRRLPPRLPLYERKRRTRRNRRHP